MKYTIHGFSQQEATKFKKNIIDKNGKLKEIKIDCTDLLILRWFVDFYPKMMKVEIEGVQYAWVQYQKILQDLPLLDIKKQALFDRLQKLCEFKILKHKTIKVNGTFSYYGFGEMYGVLIDTECSQTDGGVYSNNEGVCSQPSKGEGLTKEQINNSIKDTSSKDNKSIKDNLISEFEELWSLYPNKKGKDKALTAYIKARKAGESYETIKQGILDYSEECKLKKREKQYIKHGSTWFNNSGWKDEYELSAGGSSNGTANNDNGKAEQPIWSGDWF